MKEWNTWTMNMLYMNMLYVKILYIHEGREIQRSQHDNRRDGWA